MDATITDNQTLSRFELVKNGHTAYADYKIEQGVLTIRYVFAPEELRGTGAAATLMGGIVEYAKRENLKILPICGYALAWLRKHPEHSYLMV